MRSRSRRTLMTLIIALISTSARAEDAGVVETLEVSASATAGALVLATSALAETAPVEELTVFPLLHGDLALSREAGPFRLVGRASLLATTTTLPVSVLSPMPTTVPVLRDLGSFVEASVQLRRDMRLAVRVLPFAPPQLFRVPFDFANVTSWPTLDIATQLDFAPAAMATVSGEKWHASLGGAFSVVVGPVFAPSPPVASVPRFITEFGVEHAGLRAEFRAGVVALDHDFLGVDVPTPGRLSASARVGWRSADVGRPIDLVTYRDDPQRFSEQFASLPPPGFAFESELELGGSDQLDGIGEDPWGAPLYAQLRLAAKLDLQRLFAALRVRSPAQITLAGPGPDQRVERLQDHQLERVGPAVIGHFGVDRRLGPFVLGLSTRLSIPAVVVTQLLRGSNPPPGFQDGRLALWVSGTDGTFHLALAGLSPTLRVGVKATLRVDLGSHVTLLGEFDFDRRTFPALFSTQTAFPVQTINAHVFAQLR